jgi:hypothetical protein
VDYLESWKAQLRSALADLRQTFETRMGYPLDPDGNFVRDAEAHELDKRSDQGIKSDQLRTFYGSVGEVSLVDVHIGYFLHPKGRLAQAAEWGLPIRVEAPPCGRVETFGSDGGGGFFCVFLEDGRVYYLPPGHIEDAVYSGGLGQPSLVAEDLNAFLDRLLAVVRQFAATGTTAGIV